MMKRLWMSTLVGLFCILGFQVEVGGEAGVEGDDNRSRRTLIYAFSAEIPEQCERAQLAQELARPHQRRLQLVGVVRGIGGVALEREELAAVRRRYQLSYPLRDAAAALEDSGLPNEFKKRLRQEGDWVLLLERGGGSVYSVEGESLERIFAGFGSISTDIDESTWGKIKDLFQ
jgi:hypothetical protein